MVVNTNFGQLRRRALGSILLYERVREKERGMAPSILSLARVFFRKLLPRSHGGNSSAIADRSNSQLSLSSSSHAPMLTIDSGRSLIELGSSDQQIPTLADTIHTPAASATGHEIVTQPPVPIIETRTATVPEIESGRVALPAASNDQEDQRKWVEKAAKLLCGVALSVSVSILIAVVANMKKSARNRGEFVLYKASAGFALVAFLNGIGLLVSVMVKVSGEHAGMKMWMQMGLMVFALVFVVGAVVVIAANIVV